MSKIEIAYPNIEAERARLGLSREEFAKLIGMTRRTYYSYLRGIGAFDSTILIRMAQLTKTSTDYLLGLSPNTN